MKLRYVVKKEDPYVEIKDVLKQEWKLSARLATKIKKEKAIYLNDLPAFNYTPVKEKDRITISLDYPEENENILPTQMNLDILYENEAYLIVNKPAHLPVHPSFSHYTNTLSNGIRYYFDSIGLQKKIRPVNRLDKDTSGIILFAKNEYIQEALIRQMQAGIFQKEYLAIVEGNIIPASGIINASIARKEQSIIERCISDKGSPSITHYEVLKELSIEDKRVSVIKCKLETGRTHQIRVHMAYLGHPLLGDDLYGGNKDFISRQALHSYQISFVHPITKQMVHYVAPIPNDLAVWINA